MSFSRPVRFPLLKLPFLCIEAVIKNWDKFDIIFFAAISQKTRQIVKHLKIPLNIFRILLLETNWIELSGSFRRWYFEKNETESCFDVYRNSKRYPLMLHNKAIPLYTSKTDYGLESFTDGNEVAALKMAMEFLNELFNCSVETVSIVTGDFPDPFGVKSARNLHITCNNLQSYSQAQNRQLNILFENMEVTGTCTLWMSNTENGVYVDPKLFKCKQLVFSSGSASWVTRETFLQFEVPRLTFLRCPFSVEDILSFVTNWFHSDNNKLEYFDILYQDGRISLENFQTKKLNPVSISERNRVPSTGSFRYIDFSKGLEIIRRDGISATIHVQGKHFLFYIWNNQ
ncbi:unnamed protein product [Caenorhabditis brenneri]